MCFRLGGAAPALVAVDLLTERLLWRGPPGTPLGLNDWKLLVWLGDRNASIVIATISPDTGELIEAPLPLAVKARQAFLLDALTLVVLEEVERGPAAVSTFDVTTGARLARWELTDPRRPRLFVIGGVLVVQEGGVRDPRQGIVPAEGPICEHVLTAFDGAGRRLWHMVPPGSPGAQQLGDELAVRVRRGRLLLIAPDGSTRTTQADRGTDGAYTCATDEVVIVNHQCSLSALDRSTLGEIDRWCQRAEDDLDDQAWTSDLEVATKDAVLIVNTSDVITPSETRTVDVVSLEPLSGTLLSRVSLDVDHGRSDCWIAALVAGRLVLGRHDVEAPLVVIGPG